MSSFFTDSGLPRAWAGVIGWRGVADMQITVPIPYVVESEPATEWLLGGPIQKVSPQYLSIRTKYPHRTQD